MASISKQPNGRRTIQFTAADGKRKSIRLGKVSAKTAEGIKYRVERLLEAAITGHPMDDDTAHWVARRDSTLADRLARAGLIPKRERATLGPFVNGYLAARIDLKPRTIMKLKTTQQLLVGYFGPDKPLRDITAGCADGFRLYLVQRELSENTIRKHIAIAKQFFHSAVRKRLLTSNPFADLRSTIQPRPERFYFIAQQDAQKVLDACPDAEWRLLFALSRYGGLRCPSEHLALEWGHVDWELGRMRIVSPKTEHHAGHASRVIPIYPELRPYLEEAFDPCSKYVIQRYRDTNINLRTQLTRIIERGGLKPWPKLFQNLRSSRQTELEAQYPSHVVCAWMGNSRAVAAKHYLQVTDDHYSSALQKAVQQPAATTGNGQQAKRPQSTITSDCGRLRYLAPCQVAEEGLEPPTRGL